MSDAVISSLILALGSVIVAMLGMQQVRLGRIRKDAAETREQVANNHVDADGRPINMREEQDERHESNSSKLDRIITTLDEHGTAIATLQAGEQAQNERFEEIEDTWDRTRYSARHRIGENDE